MQPLQLKPEVIERRKKEALLKQEVANQGQSQEEIKDKLKTN